MGTSLPPAEGFFLSWSPLRSAHQNGADSLTLCDSNGSQRQRPHKNFAWDSTPASSDTHTRAMVVSNTDTTLVPTAAVVTDIHRNRTGTKNRWDLSFPKRTLTHCVR